MKKTAIYIVLLLLIFFTSCKKDEFINNNDLVTDTVNVAAGFQPQEYNLYDQVLLYINAETPGAISYQWLPTNETSPVIGFVPNDYKPTGWDITDDLFFGGYEVIITFADTTVQLGIAIFADESVVYCANSFTPNGDGINDIWTVFYKRNVVTINSLSIFNSRNKMVFYSGDNDYPAWDGKYKDDSCESGIYYYTVHFTTVQGGKKSKEGMIELTGR